MGGKSDLVKGALDLTAKLLSEGGEEAAKTGIRAYHGSPHDFDKFDMSKIGTGEGAQAYGHGLYFADQEGIARSYRDALSAAKRPVWPDDPVLADKIKNNTARANYIAEQQQYASSQEEWDKIADELAAIEDENRSLLGTKGHMYEVNIAADPNTFLDWDKPLSEQPEAVRKALEANLPEYKTRNIAGVPHVFANNRMIEVNDPSLTGRDAYILSRMGQPGDLTREQAASASSALREAGIPGIKYLDAGSRSAGDGTRNYVVFDDKLISIIRKYGIAGASAMLGYNLMENLDANQAQAATVADKEYQSTQPEVRGGMLPPGMEPSGEMTSRTPSASERIYDYVRSVLGGDEATKGQRAETVMNIIDQTPLAVGPMAYDIARGATEMAGYYKGGAVRKGYATDGAVQPGPVFMEDAKGNKYDVAGNIVPPTQDPVTDALSVARREVVDPYAEEVASAKKLLADKAYQDQSWSNWAGDVGRNLYETGMSFLPTALGGRGEVGLTDIAKGAYESAKSGVTLPGDVLTGRTNVFDPATGNLTDEALRRGMDFTGLVTMAPSSIPAEANTLRMGVKGPNVPENAEDAALKAAQEAVGEDQTSTAARVAREPVEEPYVAPPEGITPPSNALQTERGKRTVIAPTSIKLTPQEQAVVNGFQSKADRAVVAARIRETKARYPKSDGWAPFEAVSAEFDDKGNPVINWKEQTYGFNTAVQPGNRTVVDPVTGAKGTIKVNEPRALRLGTPQYEAQARKATRNGVKEVEDIIRRAGEGDENALRIIRQAGWYREFMRKGFDERGGSYPAFSDLLGATSPNTAVDQNYRYSVDLQNRFARGDFDEPVKFASEYEGSLNAFPENKLIYRDPVGPRGPQKLQYGMNSRNAQMALADKWRSKEPGQAPKARNFSGNLGGATDQATIDVWAARFINRMAGRKRLPPPVESGVKGKLGSNLEPTGEFGFGQDVFRRITDELNRKGNLRPYLQELGYENLTPMDMQALTWFIEKERWTRNNWTTAAGEGGSFEDELLKYPSERWQSGVSIQQAEPPSDVAMASTRNVFENSLRDDPNVNQYRVHPTIGRYAGSNERSFDLELTAKPGWDPRTWMAAVIREAQANNQYDVFFSKRLSPELAQTNPNARPGVEIYFRDRKTLDQALPILEEFTKRNADGFTFVTDLRLRERELGGKEAPDFVGVRMQWVPEIRMRWDEDFRNGVMEDPNLLNTEKRAALNSMQSALDALDKAGLGIVDARVHHYDTLTVGKESYDKFLDGITNPDNASGRYEGGFGTAVDPVRRFGQPIYSHAEGRNRALRASSEEGQPDTGGNVVGAGQPSGALTPEERAANFQSAFGQTYLKDPSGKPMRLYHMTPGDFSEFNVSPENRSGPVVFLSPYADFQPASHQASEITDRGKFSKDFKAGANVMPVYADVRNPLVLDHPRKIREAAAKYQGGDRNFPRIVTPEAKAAMEADGYDAIVFGGDNPIPYGKSARDARLGYQEGREEEFIIFDPRKIKSATSNRGTYDTSDPDITKALGGSVEDDDIYDALRIAKLQ